MHATFLALALLTPGQNGFDFDFDREQINYSRTRDRGFDRRGGYSNGFSGQFGNGYGNGNGFGAQFRGGGYAPRSRTFEFEARFRREPRGRFPLLRFLLCGPRIEPRFRGEFTIRER